MTKISYIDIVRNVHIDWVTADLEQEATRKGSGTSKRGARVVSSKSRKTPILGVHCDSTLRDARANSESGRVPVGSVGPLPILKALAKVVRFATLSHSVSPLRVQVRVRPTLTPSRSWLCAMPAWPARLAAAAAPTPILRLTSRLRPITRTVLGATRLPGALPLWCYPAGLLTWRQVAQALQRHGLAHRDALGACRGSGSALEVISCPYIKNTNHLKELYISKNP